jgi:pimeloyl-ACP methyl ester carboxylesterase
MGAHPDWQTVIRPLRLGLPQHGWETLSIQLPDAGAGASLADYSRLLPLALPRIGAAIDYFSKRKIKHLVLIGHGQGAQVALYYAGGPARPKPDLKGLVFIGMAADGRMAADADALKKLSLPVLDIYSSQDQPIVVAGAMSRRNLVRQGGKSSSYQLSQMMTATPDFRGQEGALLMRIRGWLKTKLPNPKPTPLKDLPKK